MCIVISFLYYTGVCDLLYHCIIIAMYQLFNYITCLGNSLENEVIDVLDLNILFQTDNENDEFFGFDVSTGNSNETFLDLRQIFNNSSSDEEFIGFSNSVRDSDLNLIFLNDSDNSEFFGF